MNKRRIDVQCPWCHHLDSLITDTYLIADPQSREYRKLKDGTFFTFECPKCRKAFSFAFPFAWYDSQKKFLIVMSDKDLKHIEEPMILVKTPEQFLLAFQTLDLGLDLSAVLQMKAVLKQRFSNIRLLDYIADKDVLLFEADGSLVQMMYHHRQHSPVNSI